VARRGTPRRRPRPHAAGTATGHREVSASPRLRLYAVGRRLEGSGGCSGAMKASCWRRGGMAKARSSFTC
jgi:hypothetical protein